MSVNIQPYDEDITSGIAGSILSGLYRTILHELAIEESRFENLVQKYISRHAPEVSSKTQSSIKTNYSSELLKSDMTWRVFVKGLKIVNIDEVHVGFQLWFSHDKPSIASVQHLVLKDHSEDEFDKVLSAFFSDMMRQAGVIPANLTDMLTDYIIRSNTPVTEGSMASARGYIKKELFKDRMSWKVFVKALIFLNVSRFVIEVQLKHRRGDVTRHRRSVILDQLQTVNTK